MVAEFSFLTVMVWVVVSAASLLKTMLRDPTLSADPVTAMAVAVLTEALMSSAAAALLTLEAEVMVTEVGKVGVYFKLDLTASSLNKHDSVFISL